MNILVIDDNIDLLDMVKYSLELEGHNVYKAANGRTGMQKAIQNKPDVILLDIMMPGEDGFVTCRKIKNQKQLSGTPVFMLTALDMIGDVETAFRCGADDYITKPFEYNELGDIIEKKLSRLKK